MNSYKQHSALDGIDASLTPSIKAQELQRKAAEVGFEWSNTSCVLDKLEEEIQEMRDAISNEDKPNQLEELGDILFLLINYGRMLNIGSEVALESCNKKFERRFRGLEKDLKNSGCGIENSSLNEMEEAWQDQKAKEKQA